MKRVGRCRTCNCWIVWTANVALRDAYCGGCGGKLERTTFPTRKDARVLHCRAPVNEKNATAIAARHGRKVQVSERDRLFAELENDDNDRTEEKP